MFACAAYSHPAAEDVVDDAAAAVPAGSHSSMAARWPRSGASNSQTGSAHEAAASRPLSVVGRLANHL